MEATEKQKQYKKQWNQDNKDKINAYGRARYQTNKDEMARQQREYYKTHKEAVDGYTKKYRLNNIEKVNELSRKRYQKNKEHFKQYRRQQYQRVKKQVFDHYGRICKCCGETEEAFLTLDHINGGGCKQRKEMGGHEMFYFWLVRNNFPSEFQTLCYNCNCAKGKLGYCPHQLAKNRKGK